MWLHASLHLRSISPAPLSSTLPQRQYPALHIRAIPLHTHRTDTNRLRETSILQPLVYLRTRQPDYLGHLQDRQQSLVIDLRHYRRSSKFCTARRTSSTAFVRSRKHAATTSIAISGLVCVIRNRDFIASC